eukprot:bmy_08752T0
MSLRLKPHNRLEKEDSPMHGRDNVTAQFLIPLKSHPKCKNLLFSLHRRDMPEFYDLPTNECHVASRVAARTTHVVALQLGLGNAWVGGTTQAARPVTTAESPQRQRQWRQQGEGAGFEVQGWEDQGNFGFGLRGDLTYHITCVYSTISTDASFNILRINGRKRLKSKVSESTDDGKIFSGSRGKLLEILHIYFLEGSNYSIALALKYI